MLQFDLLCINILEATSVEFIVIYYQFMDWRHSLSTYYADDRLTLYVDR